MNLVLKNKVFDLDRIRNTLLDNDIDFANLYDDGYSFHFDTNNKITFDLFKGLFNTITIK